MPMPSEKDASREARHSIAIVTIHDSTFLNISESMGPAFHVSRAGTERLIKSFVEDPELRALLLDLDSIGDGPKDGIEVLQEIRALREDIVLVAMTASRQGGFSLLASRALHRADARHRKARSGTRRPPSSGTGGEQIRLLQSDWR